MGNGEIKPLGRGVSFDANSIVDACLNDESLIYLVENFSNGFYEIYFTSEAYNEAIGVIARLEDITTAEAKIKVDDVQRQFKAIPIICNAQDCSEARQLVSSYKTTIPDFHYKDAVILVASRNRGVKNILTADYIFKSVIKSEGLFYFSMPTVDKIISAKFDKLFRGRKY